MKKCYIGKTINKGPTPSFILPDECSDIFEKKNYYIIEKSFGKLTITPYSKDELAEMLKKDIDTMEKVVDDGTELLTFRHIKAELEE